MESTLKFQRGDIYFIRLDSSTGSEQSGTRPAVILQNDVGNTHSPTLIVATLTSKTEKKAAQPTHCLVEPEKLEPSIVQAEQIFTIDKSRVQNFAGHLTPEEMSRVDDAVKISLALNPMGSMLIVQDAVWGRVTANREAGKSTRYFVDEFHLLLKEEQTAAYSVEIWKRFRKWGGIPTGLTQNCKDLLSSPEVSNIFENSDMIIMLNQANGDRQILAKQLNISPHQLSYVTHSGSGEGLLFYGNTILPFVDHFPHDLELYKIMTTKLSEVTGAEKHE